jgi:hypothetical protein
LLHSKNIFVVFKHLPNEHTAKIQQKKASYLKVIDFACASNKPRYT